MEGKFELISNENYDAFLKNLNVPADMAARITAAKPVLETSFAGGVFTIKTTAGEKSFTNQITIGQDSIANIAGMEYTVNMKQTANGYSGSVAFKGKTGTVSYEKTADGITQTVTIDGITAKRNFKKM